MFSTEAQQRHATAHWDSTTRQVFSKEEAELAEFLAANDKLDLTDEPTLEKPTKQSRDKPGISIEILIFVPQNFPSMNNEDDSVSTFWTSTQLQTPTVPIANLKDPWNYKPSDTQITLNKSPPISTDQPHDRNREETDTISKLSDTASRISSLGNNISELDNSFKNALMELRM